jgi:leucyl-tRNA synthetase
MDPERDRHWQEAWRAAGLAIAARIPGRRKYFALNAYPGSSGFFHVGHLRAYAYVDALHRYHRMRGEQVFFPFGVHASGLPSVTFAQKVADRDPGTLAQLSAQEVPESEWSRLEQPEAAARFLGESYRAVLERIGALADPTSYVTTIDDDYRRFISWQFRALDRAGALVRGTHYSAVCPVCGPVAVDAAETDLASGGDAEVQTFTTVPFRLDDGRVLLAATLRPETVYGVTNLWLAPGGMLRVWHHADRIFLASPKGVERLVDQHGGRAGHTVPVTEVVHREVEVPLTDRRVPILESPLVDPEVGSGVVMSVPAHAPADAAALRALSTEERGRIGPPRVLLEVPPPAGGSAAPGTPATGTPAERALAAAGAVGLADRDRLDRATEQLYRLEFAKGRMTVPPLVGIPVREARDRVAAELAAGGASWLLRAFSKPVICRNGHSVTIRQVPDQWFLHYGDPGWKAETREALGALSAWPPEYGRELPQILDWFEDRPCARRGRWLGTPFPRDPSWTIEPIADSTFYMAYFVVRRFVATGRLVPEQLTDAFFEYVFRGAGPGEPTVDRRLLEEVRTEFLYWYPLDLNMGGSEHKRVHFPVFLYTHARLLPPELRPRGIFVNGWITGPAGAKVSKKEVAAKGGRIPSIDRALAEWGADALRLYNVTAASPAQDVEWDSEVAAAAAARLGEIDRLVRQAAGTGDGPPELDAWLLAGTRRAIEASVHAFESTDLRGAAETIYARVPALLRRYYARGGVAGAATDRLAAAWIHLLSPITPHLAEELAQGRFGGLVASERFPEPDEFPASPEAEAREAFLERVEEDLRAVLRPQSGRGETPPGAVAFFIAAPWKRSVEGWIREALDQGTEPTVPEIMHRLVARPDLAAARAAVPKYVVRVAPLARAEAPATGPAVDEVTTLRAAEGYLSRRFGFEGFDVYLEEEAGPHDPMGRRDRARPGRPAFYLRPTHPGGSSAAGRPAKGLSGGPSSAGPGS